LFFPHKALGNLLGPCQGGTPALGQQSPSPAGTQNPAGEGASSRKQRRPVLIPEGLTHITKSNTAQLKVQVSGTY